MSDRITVTRPSLPPFDEFLPYLREIWDSGVITNNGPNHRRFEAELAEYLGVPYVSLFTNGTLALVAALQALRITGEVITTPYTFVATSHALLWNELTPVFVDIDPKTFNLDAAQVEKAITPKTSAIVPVHCYGRPCDVQGIESIADNYGLKVIYDAAHAFGVKLDGASVLNHGDLSILSFHATKVFNTFEGGAIISQDAKTKQRIDYLKNFGFAGETTVVAPGINGKMSEFGAALGLLQLRHIDQMIGRRKALAQYYTEALRGITGLQLPDFGERDGVTANYAYYPILVSETFGMERDAFYEMLQSKGVYGRRYFYPLVTDFPMYRGLPSANAAQLPNARAASDRVICLPLYPDMTESDQQHVIDAVRSCVA